jgi:hypothetical protein
MNMHISKIFVLCMIIGLFGIGTAMAAPPAPVCNCVSPLGLSRVNAEDW